MTYRVIDGDKVIQHLESKLSSIRSGRVNSTVLEPITVEAYGSGMKIIELATITAPEPSQLMITPFDKALIPNIVAAIQNSNLGVNPVDDGAGVRLSFPPLTEETRAIKAKEVGKELEEARIMMRSMRQDLLKSKKRAQDNDEISEDELRRFEKELQKEVDELNSNLQNTAKNKEGEIMSL